MESTNTFKDLKPLMKQKYARIKSKLKKKDSCGCNKCDKCGKTK